ncbi:hypothetical protein XI00_36030 [Bradyrhizobium sp. CCBAU 21359]|nr:hypothetical protein [Bradyrhizobium sp. CCBAU 21359]
MFFCGVFVLCMSVLMAQIIQTRLLSVISLYYMAFFSISTAMLGLTGGALIVYFKLSYINPKNVCAFLSRIATAFAIFLAICFLLQLGSPLPTIRWATFGIIWLKAILLLAAPFVVAGIAVSLALTRSSFPVGITYGVDLLGAAVGCLVTLAVLQWMDAASAMFMVAALGAAAGWFFARTSSEPVPDDSVLNWRVLSKPGVISIALTLLASANTLVKLGLQPVPAKFGRIESLSSFDYVKWNSFSRVAVKRPHIGPPFLWGASDTLPPNAVVEQRGMNIDGFAGTTMPKYSNVPGAMDFLRYDITNLAYFARHEGRSAVIGVGSGRDVLSAHIFGFRDITAVELNPIFVDLLTDPQKLRSYAGVADLPGVHLVVDDGRSWFARTREKFDLIQMSMVDTFAATGVGAFSLSENGLYTVEGWTTFLNALSSDGLFTVSRWHSPTATVEIDRAVSLAAAALMTLGVENPSDHIYVAGVSNLATIIVSRRPFASADLQKLNESSQILHFSVIASPGQAVTDPLLADLLAARSLADLNARAVRYFLDMSPPTDAKPFFFNQLRLTHLGDMITMARALRSGQSPLLHGGLVAVGNLIAMGTLFLIILLSTLVVIFVIVLPTRPSVRRVDLRVALAGSAYFLLIGLGFIFIEIGVIQRISIFLGHPVYALSVGLFSIILSTGIGSLFSERFTPERPIHFLFWIGALATYVLSLPLWLPLVTHSWLESSTLFLRAFASVLLIFPAGLLMGYGFPTGMRLTTAIDPTPTPWLWGVNGAAGVLAAGLAVACSIGFSVDATIRLGGICYILLLPFALLLRQISAGRSGKRTANA